MSRHHTHNYQLPILKEFDWVAEGSFRRGDPYAIFYVYPRKGHPFIVKGGVREVENYIQSLHITALVYQLWFRQGHTEKVVAIYGAKDGYDIRVDRPRVRSSGFGRTYRAPRWTISVRRHSDSFGGGIRAFGAVQQESLRLRKMPRRWIKELNPYTNEMTAIRVEIPNQLRRNSGVVVEENRPAPTQKELAELAADPILGDLF